MPKTMEQKREEATVIDHTGEVKYQGTPTNNGKGDKPRVSDYKKYHKNYDLIKWRKK